MKTYQNDVKFKRDFVRMTTLHRKQDRYIKGAYAKGKDESFKGCSLGCSVRSLKLLGRNGMAFNDHAGCANALGWPEWLCRLQDTIFEGLPDKERPAWTENLAKSVPVGIKSLDLVKWQFCAFILKENIERVLALTMADKLKEQVVSSIRGVLAVHESALKSGRWDESAAWSAAWSARSAAESAESAAESAWLAWSARSAAESAAWSAAESARSAAESAESAAESAWLAESAAWSAAYSRYAKELLRLLKKGQMNR